MIQQQPKTTPIPDAFIDDYLPHAENPMHVLVYILAYRYYSVGLELSVNEAAAKLGLGVEEVVQAWEYWAGCGIVEIVDSTVESFAFEFGEVQKKRRKRAIKATTPKAVKTEPNIQDKTEYTPEEMQRMQQADEQLNALFKIAERLFVKPLTYNDMNKLLGFYDWLKLPVEVIEVLLEYCVSNNKKGWAYIEAVALDWAQKGISTGLEAEEFVAMITKDYSQIMRAFGLSNRNIATKEKALMNKWLREYKMPIELVVDACDKTIMQLGKPSFPNVDKIIIKWYEADIRTVNDAKAIDDEFYKDIGGKSKGAKRAPAKSKFNNFEGHKRDYDKIFEMEQRLIAQLIDKKAGE